MLTISLVAACIALAAPTPNPTRPNVQDKASEPKKAIPVPDLIGETQYGHMCQEGRDLILIGEVWVAEGKIRSDGTIYLMWTERRTGRKAPSVYTLKDSHTLEGLWGWEEECSLDMAGNLVGTTRRDVTIRFKEAGPEI